MNCYSLTDYQKSLSHGIAIQGIDGVILGEKFLAPFNNSCFSDVHGTLSEMIFDGLLVDADLVNGEIVPKNQGSFNILVRLTLNVALPPEEDLFTGSKGVIVEGAIEKVISPVFYLHPHIGRWTSNVAILLSLPPTGSVSIKWTTKRDVWRWFRKVEVLTDHQGELSMVDGKPVFKNRS